MPTTDRPVPASPSYTDRLNAAAGLSDPTSLAIPGTPEPVAMTVQERMAAFLALGITSPSRCPIVERSCSECPENGTGCRSCGYRPECDLCGDDLVSDGLSLFCATCFAADCGGGS